MSDLKFMEYLEEVNNKLKENMAEFSALPDNASRIKHVFSSFGEFKYSNTEESKHYFSACFLKEYGNNLFKDGKDRRAVTFFNDSLITAPQNTLKGKKLYATLIGNRSAAFFRMGKYEKVLQDVAFLKEYGYHPNPDKIKAREAKAVTALRKAINPKVLVLEEDGTVKKSPCEELTWCSENQSYPALSNKLKIQTNDTMGRHVVATGDFDTGEMIAVEKPYVSVTTAEMNCQNCAISSDQIYACQKCRAVYCSKQCLQNAQVYHKYECYYDKLSPTFPLHIRLAWRMICQRPLEQVIEDEERVGEERVVDVYKTDDYYNVSQLVQHENAHDFETQTLMIISTVFLLQILRNTKYFGHEATSRDLSDKEILVGELIMKYMRIVHYNVIGVSEVQDDDYNNDSVGAGIFPTLSLFNHSCDPSVTKYNIKNMTIMRCVKPIRAGDIVYDNYGVSYVDMAKTERIARLAKFQFTCTCQACVENWPRMTKMNRKVLRGPCRCGGVINYRTGKWSGKCKKCKRVNHLEELKFMDDYCIIDMAEDSYEEGNFEEAWQEFADIIDTHYKYLTPPYYELLMHRGRLEECLHMLGNKRHDYVFDYNELEALIYKHFC